MKIGLVRHFKVKHSYPENFLLSKSQVIKWFDDYESAEIENKKVDLRGIDWKRCYSSPLNRTFHTASQIYTGEISKADELKELDILHLLPNRIQLPFMVWAIMVRIKSLSSNRETYEFRNKITNFLEGLLSNNHGDILIVSHWFVLKALQKELIKKGLRGDHFKSPEYGTLYVFEYLPPEKTTIR